MNYVLQIQMSQVAILRLNGCMLNAHVAYSYGADRLADHICACALHCDWRALSNIAFDAYTPSQPKHSSNKQELRAHVRSIRVLVLLSIPFWTQFFNGSFCWMFLVSLYSDFLQQSQHNCLTLIISYILVQ